MLRELPTPMDNASFSKITHFSDNVVRQKGLHKNRMKTW